MGGPRRGAWRRGCRGTLRRPTPRSPTTTPRWSGCSAWTPRPRRRSWPDPLQRVFLDLMDRGQLGDLEAAHHGGQLEEHGLADLLAEQGAADRRGHRHLPLLELERV